MINADFPGALLALRSHAATLGEFDKVQGHEPKNAPGRGVSCAFWVQRLSAVARRSGLDVTAARLEVHARVYLPMVREPQDDIDPDAVRAAAALIGAYNGDFTLGGLIAEVDVLGAYGTALDCAAGYFTHDGTEYRAMVLTIPMIFDDVWEQHE